MIPDRYRIGSPNGFLISSPLRRSVDCSILLADVEVLLAVVAVVADVHRQPTGLTPAPSALTASGHHVAPPRRTVMGSGDGGSDHRSLRHRIDVSEGRACEPPLVRLDVRAVHPCDVPAGLPVGGSSEWTFAGLPAARHHGFRDPVCATWIALRSLARRILELIRGDVFFWQSLQAAAILVAVPIPFVFNLFWTASSAASPWGRSRVDRLAGPPHPGRDEGGDQAQAGRPDPGHRVLAGRVADHPGPDRDDGRADLVGGEHPAEHHRPGGPER